MSVEIPVVLKPGKWLSTIVALLSRVVFKYQLSLSYMITNFVSTRTIYSQEFGNGITMRQIKSIPTSRDYKKDSTLLSVVEPEVIEEGFYIDTYKTCEISTNSTLGKQNFRDGSATNAFIDAVIDTLKTREGIDKYNALIALYQNYTPTQATQTITLKLYDISKLSNVTERNQAIEYNAKIIKATLGITKRQLMLDSTGYTDNSEMTTIVKDFSNMHITFNDKVLNYINLAESSLFHGDKISVDTYNISYDSIPEGKLTGKDDVLFYLHDKEKFAISNAYSVGGAFYDPTNMYTKNCINYAYGTGVFKNMIGLVFKVEYINAGA